MSYNTLNPQDTGGTSSNAPSKQEAAHTPNLPVPAARHAAGTADLSVCGLVKTETSLLIRCGRARWKLQQLLGALVFGSRTR